MGDELYPINLLTEEMRTDETETRIRSMRRLRTVAQALGPERTRSELLPFLSQSTDDEDEVLVAMAEELGEFVDLVGGPNHASLLLGPLEVLATVEETVVRDKAVASVQKVLDVVTDAGELALPLVKRLTEGDWFTSRVSACWLFPVAYTKVDPSSKKELRDLYTTLCGDDTPMVRRAAALNIGKFGAKMEKDIFVSTILPLFKVLTGDDQDSVRLLAIENCAAIAKLLNEDENTQHVLPVARSSCEDRSWRVRFSIAKDFFPLADAMGPNIAEGELLHHFVQLLQDAEAEVRAAAAKNISGFASLIKFNTFMSEVFPQIQPLSQDVAPNVRTAVSIVCMEIAPKLGEDVTKASLVPIMLQFLRDDVVDVRLNVLKRMSAVSPWMHAFESTLLPAITDLSKDLQWRVREAVILALPSLVSSLGATYFQEHLLEMFLNAFQDMVSEVRLSTTKILKEILQVVGSEYVLESILPKLAQIYDSSIIYQERVNVFHALTQLACDKTSPDLIGEMTSLSIRGANDKIPNVRFTVTNTLEVLGKHTDNPALTGQIQSCLAHLQTDSDPDVKYFATVALESVAA
ncbi:serine/threonine-protein phosphatase 2A 65 kDa regulatory subunit A [Achlya hypogyna]|uniref:Serine/threonine-protein phosphatase 2A 65 kDa regulatory subunit A n=1 Tax=Achlya hypogyna TaxID=1202772 RepID=A0A1V9Z1K0_ACHHY|nr:serine/threonine-protein phosphatase 2A 65 kDa regulatory subunit A [Achlya hypogyna]